MVRKPDYQLLKGLCTEKFRSPASMISKLVNNYVEYQAKKKNMSVDAYKKQILTKKLTEKVKMDDKNLDQWVI